MTPLDLTCQLISETLVSVLACPALQRTHAVPPVTGLARQPDSLPCQIRDALIEPDCVLPGIFIGRARCGAHVRLAS